MSELKDNLKRYTYVGVRGMCSDEHYNLGDICRNSYEWDPNCDCSTYRYDNPVELDGTCCICINIDELFADDDNVSALDSLSNDEIGQRIYAYAGSIANYGSRKAIIGGTSAHPGEDNAEIIIWDATVIDVK